MFMDTKIKKIYLLKINIRDTCKSIDLLLISDDKTKHYCLMVKSAHKLINTMGKIFL